MQDSPAPKKRGYAGRVYSDRKCEDCPVVFTPRSSNRKRCADCQKKHELKQWREKQSAIRKAAHVPRHCVDCGAELPFYRGMHSERCEPCRAIYWKTHNQERNKARTESGERRAYDERYRENNRETIQANNRKYKAAHPETDQAAIHRRRQRIEVRMDDLDRLLSRLYRLAIRNDPCFYCGSMETHEVDHFFPLSKGGTDHWWNLVGSCRACNRGPAGKRDTCGTAFMLRRGWPLLPVTRAPVQRVTIDADREPLRLF
jgi:predicted nucleic acid-binding Zn ribbon protein